MSVKKTISIFLVITFLCSMLLCFSFDSQVFAADEVAIYAENSMVGTELHGIYDTESEFQWYRSDSYNGEYTAILGANRDTYILSNDDIGSYVKFSAGGVMSSNYICVGNIAYKKANITSNTGDEQSALNSAFDGDAQTYNALTVSEVGTEYYICVDLEEVYLVNMVRLFLRSNRVNSYYIAVSNDEIEWEEIYAENASLGKEKEIAFSGSNSRYVKIGFTSSMAVDVKFIEIEIFSSELPRISNLSISGNPVVGETLEAVFTPEDGATLEDSKVEWYKYDIASDDSDKEKIGEGLEYTVQNSDVGKYLRCFVTPKTENGLEGDVIESSFTDIVTLPILPSVSDYYITGDAVLGETLEAVFTPENGATLENTEVVWYRYDSPSDNSLNERVGSGKTYVLDQEDIGKYMRCYITPIDINSKSGEVVISDFSDIVRAPLAPQIYNAYIDGNALVGETVTAVFSYEGNINEELIDYKWYCIKSDLTFEQSISGVIGTEKSLIITPDMKGKYLKCYITPKNSAGVEGIAKYTEAFGAVIDSNENITTASTVAITGKSAEIGSELKGVYTYVDSNGIPEGDSEYFWYRSNDRTNYQKIDGANSRTYTITAEDEGCYIKFGVKVHSQNSNEGGSIVISNSYVAVGNLAYRAEIFKSSSVYPNRPAYFVLDGNPETQAFTYGVNEDKLPYFITIDLGEEKNVSEVLCIKGTGTTTAFGVKVSLDAEEWIEAYSDSEPVQSEKVYLLNKPYKARYVRFEMMGPYSNQQIFECEVYYKPNKVAPILTLNGESTIYIPVGSSYVEPGFTATDDEKGDITDRVIVTGFPIDSNVIGEYELTYFVEDDYGNAAVTKRKVKVVAGRQVDGDVAFEKSTTASSQTSGREATKAVDGNPNTFWSPEIDEIISTLIVDLGVPQWVNSVTLNADFTNSSYSLYVSDDGSVWTEIVATSSECLLDFFPVNKRYFKVEIRKSGPFSLNDFELRLNDKGRAIIAANNISFSENLLALTTDLALSNKGLYGSRIEWSTSDPDIITKDGSITRSKTQDKSATLIAEVFVNEESHKVSFNITVLKNSSNQGGSGSGSGGGDLIKTPNIGVDNSITIGNTGQINSNKTNFSDLGSVPWAKEYIEELVAKGVIEGVGNNKFSPDSLVTREQFVKMIVTAFGLVDDSANVDFNDVDKSGWYYKFIASALKYGIVNGVSNDSFGVSNNITRQDMCVILERVTKKCNISIKTNIQNYSFDDEGNIADYARNAVNMMKSANIVSGMGNNTFAPYSYLTRAQAAKVICLLLEQVG